jgi:RND family efflux transporter MFP subunit
MISQARRAAIFAVEPGDELRLLGRWPEADEALTVTPDSVAATLKGGQRKTRAVTQGDGARLLRLVVAEGAPTLLLVLDLESRDKGQLRIIENLLAWGAEWLGYTFHQPPGAESMVLGEVFPLAAICLDQEDFQSLATTLVTELAQRLDCQRVSLGIRKRRQTDVAVLSHSAQIKQDANLLRAISLAMDEAVDQDRVIVYAGDSGEAGSLDYAHGALARETGDGCIVTLPFAHHGDSVGAVTLERAATAPFDKRTVEILERALALLAPVMLLMRHDEMGLVRRSWRSASRSVKTLLGPARYGLKLTAIIGVLASIFLATATGDWRVTADAVIEGRVQRTIAAPIDGFIKSAEARAGDIVVAGQPLGMLDDSDLKLERLKWETLRQQMVSESRDAASQRNRAEVSIIAARIEQADAELELLDEQLARTRISAPFDGVVIEGDLSQRLGTPVTRGDELFRVAPLDDYRVVLRVDERDIAAVSGGEAGSLVLASMPDRRFELTIERVTSVSTAEDGSNYFRVEASLSEPGATLRPGMEGVGKIELGEARLAWIWTRELFAWLRLKTWTWWR